MSTDKHLAQDSSTIIYKVSRIGKKKKAIPYSFLDLGVLGDGEIITGSVDTHIKKKNNNIYITPPYNSNNE